MSNFKADLASIWIQLFGSDALAYFKNEINSSGFWIMWLIDCKSSDYLFTHTLVTTSV